MATQKQMIEEILEKQKEQGDLLKDIDTALRGTEYDHDDGGLMAEVHQNTRCIAAIKKRQHKIITWGVTIFGVINLAGIVFAIISVVKG